MRAEEEEKEENFLFVRGLLVLTGENRFHSISMCRAPNFFAAGKSLKTIKKTRVRPAAGGILAACLGAVLIGSGPSVADEATAPGVAVPPRPKRIVSMTPSVTETLFALGAGSRVVGVSTYCDYPPEVSSLPRVGTFLAPSVETVIALKPDTVITSPSPGNRSPVEALERAGIKVAVVAEGSDSVDDAMRALAQTAAVIDRSLEAKAMVASIDGSLEAIRSSVKTLDRPAVAVVVGHDPLVLAGPKSYLGELVKIGGGRNIADKLGGKWPRTTLEYLIDAEPQVIIDASTDSRATTEEAALARHWSRYSQIPAVRTGRIHGHDSNLLLRPGPRIGEAARRIAGWIHPDAWNVWDTRP